MNTRNVTLSLPEPLLRKFRVYAATQNTSMTALMAELIDKVLPPDQGEDEYEKARKRLVARMKSAPLKGLKNGITWTRAELYDR